VLPQCPKRSTTNQARQVNLSACFLVSRCCDVSVELCKFGCLADKTFKFHFFCPVVAVQCMHHMRLPLPVSGLEHSEPVGHTVHTARLARARHALHWTGTAGQACDQLSGVPVLLGCCTRNCHVSSLLQCSSADCATLALRWN